MTCAFSLTISRWGGGAPPTHTRTGGAQRCGACARVRGHCKSSATAAPSLYIRIYRVAASGEFVQSWQKTTTAAAAFEFIRTRGFSDQLKLQPNYYYYIRIYPLRWMRECMCTSLYMCKCIIYGESVRRPGGAVCVCARDGCWRGILEMIYQHRR